MPYRARADNFAALAREFAKQPSLAATLEAIVIHTVATIEGAEHAAITIRRAGGKYQTVATTGSFRSGSMRSSTRRRRAPACRP